MGKEGGETDVGGKGSPVVGGCEGEGSAQEGRVCSALESRDLIL